MKTILTFIAILLPLLPLYARNNDEPLHYRLKIADKTLPPLKRIEYADSLRRVQPFEKLHPSFFSRLKREYPDLTAGEMQMCSYVMLNMTNKEIAALTRRNIRSVETMRYRLTKKMHLEEGTSLSARLFALADTAAKG